MAPHLYTPPQGFPQSKALWARHAGATFETWYTSQSAGGYGTATIASNTLYARDYFSGRGGVLDRIGIYVAGAAAAGKKMRLGIYDSIGDSNIYPGALILDSGELAADSVAVIAAIINKALPPDKLLWLAILSDGTPTVSVTTGQVDYPLGMDSTIYGWRQYISVAQAYAALPDPFPAGAVGAAAIYCPRVSVRYSS